MEFMVRLPENLNKSARSTVHNWSSLNQRFKSYEKLLPNGQGKGRQKRKSILSYLGGKHVLDMVKVFSSYNDDPDVAASILLDKIGNYCLPKFMLLYERYKFFSIAQKEGQCICEFLADLVRFFDLCELKDCQLKDRIIGGIANESLSILLKTKCSELSDAIELCQKKGTCQDSSCEVNFSFLKRRISERPISESDRLASEDEEFSLGVSNSVSEPDGLTDETNRLVSKKDASICTTDKPVLAGRKKWVSRTKRPLKSTSTRARVGSKRTAPGPVRSVKAKFSRNRVVVSDNSCVPKNPSVVLERTISQKSKSNSFFECHICRSLCTNKRVLTSHLKSSHSINVLSVTIGNGGNVSKEVSRKLGDIEKSETAKLLSAQTRSKSVNKEVELNEQVHEEPEEDEDEEEEEEEEEEDESSTDDLDEEEEEEDDDDKFSLTPEAIEKKRLQSKIELMLKRQKLGIQVAMKKSKEKKYNYECAICAKPFRWPCVLKQHFIQKHPDETMPDDLGGVCTFCGKMFKSSGTLHKHESMHTRQRFPCELCGAILVSKKKYDYHKEVRHGPKARLKPFVCEVCGKAYRFRCNLRDHSSKHSSVKPYQCDKCELSFKKKKTFNLHLKVHSGEAPYKCDTCGECFISKKPYENHVRKHSGEKPFICSTCGACFRTKPALSAHMKIHDVNRPRPFKCSTCGYSCTKRCNLVKHTLKHTGQKPHKCPICDAGFTTTYGKNKHLRRTHGIQDPTATLTDNLAKVAVTSQRKMSSDHGKVAIVAPTVTHYPSDPALTVDDKPLESMSVPPLVFHALEAPSGEPSALMHKSEMKEAAIMYEDPLQHAQHQNDCRYERDMGYFDRTGQNTQPNSSHFETNMAVYHAMRSLQTYYYPTS